MNRLLAAAFIWLALGAPAVAQTTTFTGANCNAGITISGGGLTLTASSVNNYKFCMANVGKYQFPATGNGLFYYTFTPGSAIDGQAFGFNVPVSALGNLSGASTNFLGSDPSSAGFFTTASFGRNYWAGDATSTDLAATGKTGVIALNLNTDSPQYWETNDITSLVCNGSGSTGSTNPKWNGSCASDPSIPGSGGLPNSGGTGVSFFLSGMQYFPAVTLKLNDVATLSFADNATVDGFLPAGYKPWNDNSGSTCNFPCPTDTVTINVANAPGYQTSHAYAAGSRVLAGPGWTPGSPGSFTNGAALYLWALSGSGGTSGGSAPAGFATCANPANTGGGFDGTPPSGWSGKTSVSDNGLTWVCLTAVQYPTLTTATIDTTTAWTANATGTCSAHGPGCYWGYERVINGGNVYLQVGGTTDTTPFICASATSGGPTGTGTSITDNTCAWRFIGKLVYSPQTNPWPGVNLPLGQDVNGNEMAYAYSVTPLIWYGGVAAQKYEDGQGNEADPIFIGYHQGFTGEQRTACKGGWTPVGWVQGVPADAGYSCLGLLTPFTITLTAAPGDGFPDHITAQSGPLRADPAEGVYIHSTTPYTFITGQGDALVVADGGIKISRLQVVSVNGVGIDGCCLVAATFSNSMVLFENIISGGGPAAVTTDDSHVITNNLITYAGSTAGGAVVFSKYPGLISNNTLICAPGTTNSVALAFSGTGAGVFGGPYPSAPISNNAYFGCANHWAAPSGNFPATANNANNATDLPNSTAGNTFLIMGGITGQNLTAAVLPGTSLFSLTPSNELVNATVGASFDGRVKSAAASLYNGAAGYSFVVGTGTFYGTLVPGPDIFGTVRPVAGRYDIGAEMFIPPTITGPGRMRR